MEIELLCNLRAYSRLTDCDNRHVIIQDRIISHVTSIKFIGAIIDDKLKWNLHIIYMENKIAKFNDNFI